MEEAAPGGAAGLDCIVLAAGSSTRMGRPKLLLPFGSSTVGETTAANALASGLRVILVTGPGGEELERRLRGRVLVARNPDPSRGMLSSIQEGLGLVEAEAFFVIPADMPLVGPEVYRALAASPPGRPVIPLCGGRRGHPLFLPASMAADILALPPESALRDLIAARAPELRELGVDAILRDIDTPDDYRDAAGRAPPAD